MIRERAYIYWSLSDGTYGAERAEEIVGGTVEKEADSTEYLTLGCSGIVCEEERWIVETLRRLKKAEPCDDQEQVPLAQD